MYVTNEGLLHAHGQIRVGQLQSQRDDVRVLRRLGNQVLGDDGNRLFAVAQTLLRSSAMSPSPICSLTRAEGGLRVVLDRREKALRRNALNPECLDAQLIDDLRRQVGRLEDLHLGPQLLRTDAGAEDRVARGCGRVEVLPAELDQQRRAHFVEFGHRRERRICAQHRQHEYPGDHPLVPRREGFTSASVMRMPGSSGSSPLDLLKKSAAITVLRSPRR